MSNKILTEKEIDILSNSQYVKNVSAKEITYTDEMRSYLMVAMLLQ